MKKQINPTIKAHLIRGAFYLLLLVAVCAIPFALAQRNTIKRGAVNPTSKSKTSMKLVDSKGVARTNRFSSAPTRAVPQTNPKRLLSYDVRPSVGADSVSKHVTTQLGKQTQRTPVSKTHQVDGALVKNLATG